MIKLDELPPPPQDVLDALEKLPEEVVSEINQQMAIFSGLKAINNPRAVSTERGFRKFLIKNSKEHCRLILEAAKEVDRG